MAGALGLKLAGPRVYGEQRVEDAFMGDGRREADATDIRRALALYRSEHNAAAALDAGLAARPVFLARVERGEGTLVTVPELLQLVREAALKAIADEFTGDQLSLDDTEFGLRSRLDNSVIARQYPEVS